MMTFAEMRAVVNGKMATELAKTEAPVINIDGYGPMPGSPKEFELVRNGAVIAEVNHFFSLNIPP